MKTAFKISVVSAVLFLLYAAWNPSGEEPIPIDFALALAASLVCVIPLGCIVLVLICAVSQWDCTKSDEENKENFFVKLVMDYRKGKG